MHILTNLRQKKKLTPALLSYFHAIQTTTFNDVKIKAGSICVILGFSRNSCFHLDLKHKLLSIFRREHRSSDHDYFEKAESMYTFYIVLGLTS